MAGGEWGLYGAGRVYYGLIVQLFVQACFVVYQQVGVVREHGQPCLQWRGWYNGAVR